MTISDFSQLHVSDQIALLYADGVYLSKRKKGRMTILLFQLEQAYVEIFYIHYRRIVHHIETSESSDVLDPYLSSIPIENLFSDELN